ncbi:6-phospho-3-hexuloisomerase [Leptolinea tardivitalis]|uniref:6-phospho 3-hexuloisomerase n=1 Tax=Leptolinea tardivitalis TaxID=229920 RepID=A0A0P6XIN1_9CHLR|nr:6-phospho-3-hexuloisomerase [Leptolinea tardivitalis]KPL71032.1 6-phospho 3-hexuloisomerase [Leptolinea tardivitalis]GAP22435.1 3-hexulose-6-phosphate isomerase [Leptolinea tardivitalis]
MDTVEISLSILKELEGALKQIDPARAESLVDAILSAGRVFIAGTGRSGMMMRGLAMRLMHLGFNACVVGETITPAIQPGDLLIIGSGSGETATLTTIARKAKSIGARVALITIYPESTIGKLADLVVPIKAVTTKSREDSGATSIQPGGSMFEQSLLLFCDAMVIRIIEKKGITDSNSDLMKRHANLE